MAELRRLVQLRHLSEEERRRPMWWSQFRRQHQAGARRCHFKRRALQAPSVQTALASEALVLTGGTTRLSDAQWEQIQPLLPKYVSQRRQHPSDPRLVIEGILWVMATGASWREVPKQFGPWNRVAEHYYRWCKQGRWALILQVLQKQEVPLLSSA